MPDYLDSHWPPTINALSTPTRRWALSAAIAAPLILLSVLSNVQPGVPPDSGLAGCTALSDTHQAAATKYPRIRAEFTGSRWPDLRISGLAYVEIATELRARHAYGGETVWFIERLAAACAKHGPAGNRFGI